MIVNIARLQMSLTVKNLTKTFGEKVAVDNISFEMKKPGVFGLIGTNGAGKTTTIRMILGIMRPDFGEALFDGEPISRRALNFGYLPEERGIYTKDRVLEQLVYFGELRGMSRAKAKASASELLERFEITEYANMTADKLSKGNQQKVQLAATLIHDPELIFLDEPFSGLDPVNAESLRKIINGLVDEKKYIIMSSHQMATVEEYCEDLVLLHKGKALIAGNLKQIKAGYGVNKLLVSADGDIIPLAESVGMQVKEKRADGIEFSIPERAVGEKFFALLAEKSVIPTRFEMQEPSLNEIFIEKVGKSAEVTEK